MSDGAPKKSRTGLIIAIAVLVLSVPCCGVLAAVAIPAFIGYTRRSKTAEVEDNLRNIYMGAATYYQQERFVPGTVTPITSQLPAAAPPTPPTPGCGTKQIGHFSHPSWIALGFTPMDPLYYSYEWIPGGDGRTFVIRATGDLDCDSLYSIYELHGFVTPGGEIAREPDLRITNELE